MAVLDKYDYKKIFGRIEEEKLEKKVAILRSTPILKNWARTTVLLIN